MDATYASILVAVTHRPGCVAYNPGSEDMGIKAILAFPATMLLACLLGGCADNSASYTASGASDTVTIHNEQPLFWSDELELTLIASRLPDCQRRFHLASMAAPDVDIELFAGTDQGWIVRLDKQLWQVDTQTCNATPVAATAVLGERLGAFKVDDDKHIAFESGVADAAPQPAGAEPSAPAASAPTPAPAQPPAAEADSK
jgi:hypothetical protein